MKPVLPRAEEQGKRSPTRLEELEAILGYSFKDLGLLQQALTHRSLLNEILEEGRSDICSVR